MVAERWESAAGEILAVAGDFGSAAVKLRSVASDFVPSAGEVGIAACVFGCAERVFRFSEENFGIAERVFGTAEGKFGTAEEIFRIPVRTAGAAGNARRSLSADGVDGTMKRGPFGASLSHRGGRMDSASPWDGSNRDGAEGDMVVAKP